MYPLTDEQKMLVESIRGLSEKHFAAKSQHWDRESEPPLENLKTLAEHGYLGIGVPEAYGGLGAGILDLVLTLEQIAKVCPNTALLAASSDGATPRAIAALGSEKQKQRYLPGFVTGETIPAWGMSEPNAGSDVGAIETRAVKKDGRFVINGSKLWCTGAQIANVFLVFARISEEKGLGGVGAILVESGSDGFSVGKHIDVMGLRGTGMAELNFIDCEVPEENLLLQPGRMKDLLTVFNIDRVATNPPICLGAAAAAMDIAVAHMEERKQFGRRLADFQGLQWRVAEMAMDLAAARALIYQTAASFDRGEGRSLDASISKSYANEMANRVTQTAIQMLGAYGITKEFRTEQMMRDVRGLSFGYGTLEVQRNMIARDIFAGQR